MSSHALMSLTPMMCPSQVMYLKETFFLYTWFFSLPEFAFHMHLLGCFPAGSRSGVPAMCMRIAFPCETLCSAPALLSSWWMIHECRTREEVNMWAVKADGVTLQLWRYKVWGCSVTPDHQQWNVSVTLHRVLRRRFCWVESRVTVSGRSALTHFTENLLECWRADGVQLYSASTGR